jgi:hypothetical protein
VDLLRRLVPGRWRRRAPVPVDLDPADPSLVLLIRAPDAARADSAVLAEAAGRGVDLSVPLLVRHHLVGLPDAAAVAEAERLLSSDGYRVLPGGDGPPLVVLAARTQVLTALSASQERSRMAGLAQRLGGDVAGWDALGRPPAPAQAHAP